MTPIERMNFASNLGFLLGSGRVKDAEALVDQVAHGTHPNVTTAIVKLDLAVNPPDLGREEEDGAKMGEHDWDGLG